uniref:EGF-like domain-containing protein n=1 Tax=Macrostomum lignano TaxID=282301 RepID=A0A1I8JNK6_9PLAT
SGRDQLHFVGRPPISAFPLVYPAAAAAPAATPNGTGRPPGYHYVYTYGGSVHGRVNGRLGRLRVPASPCEATRGSGAWCLAFGCQASADRQASPRVPLGAVLRHLSLLSGNSSRAPGVRHPAHSCSICTEKSLRNAPDHLSSTAVNPCGSNYSALAPVAVRQLPCRAPVSDALSSPSVCTPMPAPAGDGHFESVDRGSWTARSLTLGIVSESQTIKRFKVILGPLFDDFFGDLYRDISSLLEAGLLNTEQTQPMRQIISRRRCTECASSVGALRVRQSGLRLAPVWAAEPAASALPAAFIEPLRSLRQICIEVFAASDWLGRLSGFERHPVATIRPTAKSCLARCRGRGWLRRLSGRQRRRPVSCRWLRQAVGGRGAACASPSSWHFDACPPENECENGHHNCDLERQVCVDQIDGFRCECRPGYNWNNATRICEPGRLPTKPDVCTCLFGSHRRHLPTLPAHCNGHSNCAGPSPADRATCLSCHNNTRGSHCQFCSSAARGRDAASGQACLPCSQPCARATLRAAAASSGSPRGNYRLGFNRLLPCKPCQCNGHSDFCLPDTGQGCRLARTTPEHSCTDPRPARCRRAAVRRVRGFLFGQAYGRPAQCYHKMGVNNYFCLDYRHSQKACGVPDRPPLCLLGGPLLLPGETPASSTSTSRLFVDIIRGAADLYLRAVSRPHIRVNNTVDANGFWSNLVSIDYQAAGGNVAKATRRSKAPLAVSSATRPVLSDRVLEVSANPYLTYVSLRRLSGQHPDSEKCHQARPHHHSVPELRVLAEQFYLGVSTDVNVSGIVFLPSGPEPHQPAGVLLHVSSSCFFLLFAPGCAGLEGSPARTAGRVVGQRRNRERQSMAARPFVAMRGCVNPAVLEPLVHRELAGKAGQAAALVHFCAHPAAPSPAWRLLLTSQIGASFALGDADVWRPVLCTQARASPELSIATQCEAAEAAANAEIVVVAQSWPARRGRCLETPCDTKRRFPASHLQSNKPLL